MPCHLTERLAHLQIYCVILTHVISSSVMNMLHDVSNLYSCTAAANPAAMSHVCVNSALLTGSCRISAHSLCPCCLQNSAIKLPPDRVLPLIKTNSELCYIYTCIYLSARAWMILFFSSRYADPVSCASLSVSITTKERSYFHR